MLYPAVVVFVIAVVVRLIPSIKELPSITASVITALVAVYLFYDWKWNIWVVTDKRVIDEWGVFSKNSKITPLDRIENIEYHQSLIGRILDFGDIKIQSAAEKGDTSNRYVESPELLRDTIIERKKYYLDSAESRRNGTKPCPHCAEDIKKKAKVCRYCGRDI
jgi:uncharacterized membrane protein YdbT with pleckstrin-like domain